MRCGLTLPEACACSLGQLKLLNRAADREQAAQALMDSEVTLSAVAAAWSKEGGKLLREVNKRLLEKLTKRDV